jgi:multidrug efflux pump
MNNTAKAEQYAAMPVPKAVVKNAVPAIISMIMVLVYNLADTFFIGQTHNALLVAAVSVATPVFLFLMAIGTLFGIGGTSVISRSLGRGDTAKARSASSFCFWSSIVTGLASMVLFLVAMTPLLKIIGASSETAEYVRTYLTIVSFGAAAVVVSNCFSNILRAEGRSTEAMAGMIIGNAVNVVLDPIAILWLNWGVAGAAITTVIGNVCGALYYLIYFLRGKSVLSISPKEFRMGDGICSGILSIGIPASLNTLLMNLSCIILNKLISSYGDMCIAGIGVAMKVNMILVMVVIGFAQGVQPLLGYAAGEKNWKRFRSMFSFSLIVSTILSIVLTAVCFVCCSPIVRAFLTDSSAYAYGVSFSKVLLVSGPLFGLLFMITNALQALGAAVPSLILSISRQGLIFIPFVFILNAAAGLSGLVWTQPVSDIISSVLAVALYTAYARRTGLGAGTAS